MSTFNKFGLPRHIPADIRREIRKRCGFGCVICGLGFYDYEHFDPDFAEAKSHDPNGMTLLCMQCNQKRNRKLLSRETVKAHNKNPAAISKGFCQEWLDVSCAEVEVVFAGSSYIQCSNIIEVNENPILAIRPPQGDNEPYRISGFFSDATGAITLKIDENVWKAGADNWDVEWTGPKLTIRNGPGSIVLILRSEPPHKLIVERLNMLIDDILLIGDEEKLQISFSGGPVSTIQTCSMRNCRTGISLSNK